MYCYIKFILNKEEKWMAQIVTRSGKSPDDEKLPFSFSTTEIETYLQKKLDVALNAVAKANGEKADKIEVKLYTTEAGKPDDKGFGFLPIMVILPLEALESRREQKKSAKMASIFDTKAEDGTASLKRAVYEVLSAYVFDKYDANAFKSNSWQREHHVSRETATYLINMRTPHVIRMNGGKTQVVGVLIDPVRILHDMTKIEGDNRNYHVNLYKYKKYHTGEYLYILDRVVKKSKGNKKYEATFADELNRKMRGFRK